MFSCFRHSKQCRHDRQVPQDTKGLHVGGVSCFYTDNAISIIWSFVIKMSKRKQLEKFNPDFVSETMDNWVKASLYYQQEAEKSYTKLRSYLTMYQFRLTDQ